MKIEDISSGTSDTELKLYHDRFFVYQRRMTIKVTCSVTPTEHLNCKSSQ